MAAGHRRTRSLVPPTSALVRLIDRRSRQEPESFEPPFRFAAALRKCSSLPAIVRRCYISLQEGRRYKITLRERAERFIVQELCESRGGRPELSVLTSLLVSVDVIGLSLSLICQLTSEDIKQHYLPTLGHRARGEPMDL